MQGVQALAQHMTNLRALTLHHLKLGLVGARRDNSQRQPAMEDLIVSTLFDPTNSAVASTLTSLSLNTGYPLTEAGLQFLAESPYASANLVTLKLTGEINYLSFTALSHLQSFTSLRCLTFSSKFLSLSKFKLSLLPPSLVKLNLYNQRIEDEIEDEEKVGSSRRGFPPHLEKLKLVKCHKIRNTLARHLGPSLTHLEIEIHDQEIVLVPASPTTQKVAIDDRGVTVDTSRLSTSLQSLVLKCYSAASIPQPLPHTMTQLSFLQYEFRGDDPLDGIPLGLRGLELTRGNATDDMLYTLSNLDSLQTVKLVSPSSFSLNCVK